MAIEDKRRGMKTASVNQEVIVSQGMIDKPLLYKARYRIEWGKGDFTESISIYCHREHDLSISWMIRDLGLTKKRIKKVKISEICDVGKSIAEFKEIKEWEITSKN